AAADDPDAVGDLLGALAVDPGHDPRTEVREPREARLGARPSLGQEAELARDRARVDVGVVALDQLVGDRDYVAALEIDPSTVGDEPLEASRPGERPAGLPANRATVAVRGRVEDLERQIRERVKQLPDVGADPVGSDQVLLTHE